MSANLSSYRWRLPAARAFLDALSGRARQGVNTIVLVNDLVQLPELAIQIAERFEPQDAIQPYTLDLSDRPAVDPLVEMSHALRVHGSYCLEQLRRTEGHPQAWIVYGMDAAAGRRQAWAAFARDWAALPQDGLPGNVLIVLCRFYGEAVLPPGDRFQYVKWNNEVSALETSLCCRMYGKANSLDPILQLWIEAMLSSLAPGDETLAGNLWESTLSANGVLQAALREYARGMGWKAADAIQAVREFPTVVKQRKPADLGRWWGRGWLVKSVEYGLELHSALLALAEEGEDILSQRIWRAQAALVLPEIDRLRRRLLEKARLLFPNQWKLSDVTEFGELETILRGENNHKPAVSKLLDDTSLARQIRNDLAHYKPVRFERYNELLQRNQRP